MSNSGKNGRLNRPDSIEVLKMDTDKKAPRLLGAAFLIVVFTSLSAGLIHNSAVGSGDISEILAPAGAGQGARFRAGAKRGRGAR